MNSFDIKFSNCHPKIIKNYIIQIYYFKKRLRTGDVPITFLDILSSLFTLILSLADLKLTQIEFFLFVIEMSFYLRPPKTFLSYLYPAFLISFELVFGRLQTLNLTSLTSDIFITLRLNFMLNLESFFWPIFILPEILLLIFKGFKLWSKSQV